MIKPIKPKKISLGLKPVEELTWEDENFVNHATAYKDGKTEGIALRTQKKYGKRKQWRKSFWLQKNQDVNAILEWTFTSVKILFAKLWGKQLITPKEIEKNKKLVEELREQVKRKEKEFEELNFKYATQQKELSLAKEVIEKSDDYESTLKNFESVIKRSKENNERIEKWVKTEIKNNRWILGLDCEVKATEKTIDPQTGIDMHIETNYGEDRIIEAKSPNLPIFTGGKNKRQNIHGEFATALSEIIEYIQRTVSYSQLRQPGPYKIDKPIGRILAGYKLNDAEKRLLDEWNFHLSPVIKIITYDNLIQNAKKELELIKIAKRIK